jgi:hypothetical protein
MANLSDSSPAKQGALLANSATAFEPCRAIFVDVAGSATVTFNDGGSIAFTALPVGLYPFSIKKLTAGTASVIALY